MNYDDSLQVFVEEAMDFSFVVPFVFFILLLVGLVAFSGEIARNLLDDIANTEEQSLRVLGHFFVAPFRLSYLGGRGIKLTIFLHAGL